MANEPATIVIKDGCAICPACGKGKLVKFLRPTTVIKDLSVKCKQCGQTTVVNINTSLSP